MKSYFWLLIILTTSIFAYSQEGNGNEIDAAIQQTELEVGSIDKEICYKTLVDWSGYRLGEETDINEWLAVLYFDKDYRIRKSKFMFSFPEEDGFYYRYFNIDGVAIQSYYATSSGMSNSYSVLRYLNNDKSLLYIDFLRKDDDRNGIIVEHTKRSGGYDLTMPQIGGALHDKVLDLKDLVQELEQFYGIDSLYIPQIVDTVKFINPRKGDITFVIQNYVPVFKDPIDAVKPIDKFNVGYKVEVLATSKNWYKVRYRYWGGDQLKCAIGYIQGKYLAPVEIEYTE